jgi:hypothetical protein
VNKNEKFSELLRFVAKIAKFNCKCECPKGSCVACDAVDLLRRVTFKEDAPIDTGE